MRFDLALTRPVLAVSEDAIEPRETAQAVKRRRVTPPPVTRSLADHDSDTLLRGIVIGAETAARIPAFMGQIAIELRGFQLPRSLRPGEIIYFMLPCLDATGETNGSHQLIAKAIYVHSWQIQDPAPLLENVLNPAIFHGQWLPRRPLNCWAFRILELMPQLFLPTFHRWQAILRALQWWLFVVLCGAGLQCQVL